MIERTSTVPGTLAPPGPVPLTPGQRRGVLLVGFPAAILALLGFGLAYKTMSARLEPTFGEYAGVAVVVIDLSIAVSSAAALLLLWIGIRIWWLRLVPWGLIAVSVALNAAAGTEWWEKVAHSAMPALWAVFVEIVIIAVSRRMRVTEGPGERPRWGWRLLTLPRATVPEMLAWTNHPRGGDITVDLAGAMEHRRRVRARKDAERAQRAADGLGWWPWMRARTHVDALAAMRAGLVDERDQAVAKFVDERDQAAAALQEANSRLAQARAAIEERDSRLAELEAGNATAGTAARTEAERRQAAETALREAESRVAALSRDVDVALTEAIAEGERAAAAERELSRVRAAGIPAGTRPGIGTGNGAGIRSGNGAGIPAGTGRESRRASGGHGGRNGTGNRAGTPTANPATAEAGLSKSDRMAHVATAALEAGEAITGAELARRCGGDASLGRRVLSQVRRDRAGLHPVSA